MCVKGRAGRPARCPAQVMGMASVERALAHGAHPTNLCCTPPQPPSQQRHLRHSPNVIRSSTGGGTPLPDFRFLACCWRRAAAMTVLAYMHIKLKPQKNFL